MASADLEKCHADTFYIPREDLGVGVHGFAVDFGNSLIKVAYITPSQKDEDPVAVSMVSFPVSGLDGVLNFIKETIIDPLNGKTDPKFFACSCGASALMYKDKITKTLGISFNMHHEFACFAKGIKYILEKKDDVIAYTGYCASRKGHEHAPPIDRLFGLTIMAMKNELGAKEAAQTPPPMFPCLVCFAGSSFVMEKINADGSYDAFMPRPIGGLYFYALGKLLTGCENFAELMDLAARGDTGNLSFTVKDFPTDALTQGDMDFSDVLKDDMFKNTGLPFSKLLRDGIKDAKKEDIANTLLHTFCDDLVHECINMARRLGCQRVYLCGSFCNGNPLLEMYVKRLEFSEIWVDGPLLTMSLLKHSGYIGCIGNILRACDDLAMA